ncbi:unnamed protein product, partial [Heterotrigona itama]
ILANYNVPEDLMYIGNLLACSQNNLTDGEEDLPEDTFSLLSVLLVANTQIDSPLAQFVRPILSGFLFLILIFLSVAGNILVCVAIYTDRGLRRIGNLFLASLAIADLFVGCLVMTFAGVNDLLGYWVFGPRFCDTWIAFDVMCSTASILNLCAISLDRYIHIKDPLRYGRWVTRRVAVAGIAIVWLLAGLISFVPISLGLHRADEPVIYDDGKEEHPMCALDLTLTYAIVSSSISFYVPCIVMLGIYCRLYCYAQKHVKSIRAVTKLPDTSMAKSFRAKSTRNKPPKPQTKTKPTSPYHVSDHKAAITVGVIMGVFLICWVPFFCVNIVASYCKTCISVRAFQVLTWLGYSNSAFNPIIYSIFNTEFREAFKRILTKGARARGNQPSTSECGEFRSVVVQKRNGSMVECNISPRSSADSCQVGIMAQRHRDTIVSSHTVIWVEQNLRTLRTINSPFHRSGKTLQKSANTFRDIEFIIELFLETGANVSPKLLRNPSNLTQICVTYMSEKNPCEPMLIEPLPSSISAIHNVYYIPINEKLHLGYHN